MGLIEALMGKSRKKVPVAFLKDHTDILFLTSIWVINALLCAIPILLVKKRYSYILTLRQKM